MDEFDEFKAEANEMIEKAEEALLQVDKGAPFQEHYNSVFRVLHNLKGTAGMLGWTELNHHVHKVETLFQERSESESLSKQEVSFFLNALDATKRIIEGQSAEFDYSFGDQSPDKVSDVKPAALSKEIPLEPTFSTEHSASGSPQELHINLLESSFALLSEYYDLFAQSNSPAVSRWLSSLRASLSQLGLESLALNATPQGSEDKNG